MTSIINLKDTLTFRNVAKIFPGELRRSMLAEGSHFERWLRQTQPRDIIAYVTGIGNGIT